MDDSKLLDSKVRQFGQNLPWCTTDVDKLGPVVSQFVYDHETFMNRWAQKWFENFQFIYGNQSVKWSRRYDFAVDVDFLRRNTTINQKSQTNISRVIAEALGSLIYSSLPDWEAETAEDSYQKGKRFRVIAQKLLDAYMERLSMDKEFEIAALIFVVYGQHAFKIDWDNNAGNMMHIPKWQKTRAPVFTDYMSQNQSIPGGLLEVPIQALDSSGQPMFQDRWEPVLGPDGRQQVDKVFAGDVKVDVLTPIEYRREIGSRGMHKTKWVEHLRLMDYDEWVYEYGELEGKTKHFTGVAPITFQSKVYNMALKQYMRMQMTTPPSLQFDGNRRTEGVLSGNLFKNKVFVIEHYDRPRKGKWDRGRKLVITNGLCTHITKPSYYTNKIDGWHPFVESQWLTIAPSSIASGPLNDVIAKNRELNVKDSLIATAVRRNMGSMLLLRAGMGLDKNLISGTPGEMHEVNDVNGARWVNDETPIPPVIKDLRQQDKDDVYESSGAGDAIRGERSPNVSSGYAQKQLDEREQRRLTPARKNFGRSVSGAGEKIIACLKHNVKKLDDNVMGYLKRSASGEFTEADVIAFLSQPIEYGIDINIKDGSLNDVSKATKQATLLELAKGPAAERVSKDAEVLDVFLKYFDAEPLRDASSVHRDRAQRENETFSDLLKLGPDSEGLILPVVMFDDDDDVHMSMHVSELLRNDSEILKNEWLFQQWLLHLETHRIQKKEKAGELPPGSSLQVPAMLAQARKAPAPTIPTIYQETQQKQLADQQQQQQPPPQRQGASAAPPPAPRLPKPPGAKGAPPLNPQAPSQNTPPAAQGGLSQ